MARTKHKKIYVVLISGDRNAKAKYVRILKREITKLVAQHGVTKLLILQGGCTGVDFLADRVATSLNVHSATVNALWKTRHGSAGPQRNTVMAELQPDECIAIHHDIEESVGTANMIQQCEKRGIPVRLFDK